MTTDTINFFTIKEVAKMLKMHPITIYRYCEKNKIKGIKIGNAWRISELEVKRIMGV